MNTNNNISNNFFFIRNIIVTVLSLKQHQHQLAELGRKQLEQNMQQLQEQLQLNLIQQTHLLQTADKKKNSVPLQQLGVQQHQIIQQLQMTQRQYLFQQGLSLQSHNHSTGNLSNDNVPAWKSEPNESNEAHQNSLVPKSGASLNGIYIIYLSRFIL